MRAKIIMLAATMLALSGCATETAAPKVTWRLPGVPLADSQREFAIDGAECRVLAMQSVAIPAAAPMRTAPIAPSPRTYTVRGSTSQGSFHGTITEREQSSFWSGFATASSAVGAMQEQRAQERARSEAAAAQEDLVVACMLRRGWERGTLAPNGKD